MSKHDVYKSGYKQGTKGDVIHSFLHNVGNAVTGNMFGSKTQKVYNAGYKNGEQARRDSKKSW